jgi:hypothetical protein
MGITCGNDLSVIRTLSINPNNGDRTVSLSGNLTVSAAATVSGTNTGDQTITLTGDVTGSGTGSFAATLATSGVTAGTYNNVATQVRPFTVDAKGRITGIGTAVTIAPAWGSITGTPTTLAGYGITDAQPLNAKLSAISATGSADADTLDVLVINTVGNLVTFVGRDVGLNVLGASTQADGRTALGLGTMAIQNANAVAITGGTISAVTLSNTVIDGGTF